METATVLPLQLKYEFEIAYSFCREDEAIAQELDDLLRDRFKTFLYSRKQEQLAGADGEEAFAAVFAKKTRVSVILYRAKWGETPFTRIEQTAIRGRAYHEGYDFTLWIVTEPGARLPPYVPPTRLYLGLGKYGIKSAAAVIEHRVQEVGGMARVESVADKAIRLQRQLEAEEACRQFLNSDLGVQTAKQSLRELYTSIEKRAQQLQQETKSPFNATSSKESALPWMEVATAHAVLSLNWHQVYGNTLKESYLELGIWDGPPPRADRWHINGAPPRRLSKRITFDRSHHGVLGWKLADEFIPATQISDRLVDILLNHSHKRGMAQK